MIAIYACACPCVRLDKADCDCCWCFGPQCPSTASNVWMVARSARNGQPHSRSSIRSWRASYRGRAHWERQQALSACCWRLLCCVSGRKGKQQYQSVASVAVQVGKQPSDIHFCNQHQHNNAREQEGASPKFTPPGFVASRPTNYQLTMLLVYVSSPLPPPPQHPRLRCRSSAPSFSRHLNALKNSSRSYNYLQFRTPLLSITHPSP